MTTDLIHHPTMQGISPDTPAPYTPHIPQISLESWPSFAAQIAAPAKPTEHRPAAVERLNQFIKGHRVDIKGIRGKYKSVINTQLIEFDNPKHREVYERAVDRYIEECERLDKSIPSEFAMLRVAKLKLQMAAELLRSPYMARRCVEIIAMGKAPAIACNFKQTIAKIVQLLVKEHGMDRRKISLIWGGIATKDQRLKDKKKMADEALDDSAIDDIVNLIKDKGDLRQAEACRELLKSKQLEMENELYEFEQEIDELKLGTQTPEKRKVNIDRYQLGKSDVCMFTFKSGGVALSLHDTDFHNCRDDIRRECKGRPRYGLIAPTYSAIETVQGVGRLPRITSQSDTYQDFIFFNDTVEVEVAAILKEKLKSLKALVMQKENWDNMLDRRRTTRGGNKSVAETIMDSDELDDSDNVLMGEGFDGQ